MHTDIERGGVCVPAGAAAARLGCSLPTKLHTQQRAVREKTAAAHPHGASLSAGGRQEGRSRGPNLNRGALPLDRKIVRDAGQEAAMQSKQQPQQQSPKEAQILLAVFHMLAKAADGQRKGATDGQREGAGLGEGSGRAERGCSTVSSGSPVSLAGQSTPPIDPSMGCCCCILGCCITIEDCCTIIGCW